MKPSGGIICLPGLTPFACDARFHYATQTASESDTLPLHPTCFAMSNLSCVPPPHSSP